MIVIDRNRKVEIINRIDRIRIYEFTFQRYSYWITECR